MRGRLRAWSLCSLESGSGVQGFLVLWFKVQAYLCRVRDTDVDSILSGRLACLWKIRPHTARPVDLGVLETGMNHPNIMRRMDYLRKGRSPALRFNPSRQFQWVTVNHISDKSTSRFMFLRHSGVPVVKWRGDNGQLLAWHEGPVKPCGSATLSKVAPSSETQQIHRRRLGLLKG